jgi:nicotinate dehydrogenase subunit A
MLKKIELQINGRSEVVKVHPETPLLYVLRNTLGLYGAKYGCGLGQCGACMVLIEGKAAYSCLVQVGRIKEKPVTTIEGLSAANTPLHTVQKAFIDTQAGQCGYCTNGMIMAGVSLLKRNADPSEAEIKKTLQGNLCRCGTQPRVIKAIRAAVKDN